MTPEVLTIADMVRLSKRSKSTILRDIKSGRLHAVKIGRSTRIPIESAERYLSGEDVSIIQTPTPLPRRQS